MIWPPLRLRPNNQGTPLSIDSRHPPYILKNRLPRRGTEGGEISLQQVKPQDIECALAGGSSAALHNVLIGHGPSRVRSESIRSRYVKAGQGKCARKKS